MSMKEREILRFLDRHPFIDSLLEISSIVIFALMPLVFASLVAMADKPEFDLYLFGKAFYSFLSDGEFVILTIGICGSIVWLGLVKLNNVDGALKYLFIFLPIIAFAFPASIVLLPKIKNAQEAIPLWLFWASMASYALCLVVYLWALYVEKTQESPHLPDPAAKADALLKAAGRKDGD